jgi:hypothetical protein
LLHEIVGREWLTYHVHTQLITHKHTVDLYPPPRGAQKQNKLDAKANIIYHTRIQTLYSCALYSVLQTVLWKTPWAIIADTLGQKHDSRRHCYAAHRDGAESKRQTRHGDPRHH